MYSKLLLNHYIKIYKYSFLKSRFRFVQRQLIRNFKISNNLEIRKKHQILILSQARPKLLPTYNLRIHLFHINLLEI